MTYEIKMINGDKFKISEETFNKLAGKSGLIYIPDIKGIINLVSVASILPGELSENSGNRRQLYDGSYAINKFGIWYDEKNPEVRIDLNYYPELKTSTNEQAKQIEQPSSFGKELSKNLN